MNTDTNTNYLISFLIGTIITCILIYKFSFNKKKNIFTCNKFLTNTYLYLVLSLLIMSLFMTILLHYGINLGRSLQRYLLLFLLIIALLIIKNSIVPNTPGKMITKHLVWLVLLFVFALNLVGMISRTSRDNVLKSVVTTGILVLILTLFAHYNSDLISFILFTIIIYHI